MKPYSSIRDVASHMRSYTEVYEPAPLDAMPVGAVRSTAQNAGILMQLRYMLLL